MHKKALFLLKDCKKNRLEQRGSPPDPLAFGGWVLRPKTSNPLLKIPGYANAPHHSFNAEYQAGKHVNTNFLSLLVGLDERN